MDISNNKKAKIVILISVILVIAVLIAVVFAITSKKINNSTSQGISNPSGDSQTDIKVINLGDEEPENEIFAYRITEEDEEKMLEEAHKKLEEELSNKQIPTDEELAETANRLKEEGTKFDINWNYIKQLTNETLILYNGKEKVEKIENAYLESLKNADSLGTLDITKEHAEMYDFWLTTIEEHEEEMDKLVIDMIMTSISPIPLKLFVEKNQEYSYILDKYNNINNKYPYADIELQTWCENN